MRAQQQWQESKCEKWEQAKWKNLWGLAPGGVHYDDPGEASGPIDYVKSKGIWNFLSELGYF
jgi:hypothetical protein